MAGAVTDNVTPRRVSRGEETALLHAILQVLRLSRKGLFWRNNTGALRTMGRGGRIFYIKFGLGVGSPDIVGILAPSGRFFGLEVKTPAGRLSKEQTAWHKAAQSKGAYVGVARSAADAFAALEEATRASPAAAD